MSRIPSYLIFTIAVFVFNLTNAQRPDNIRDIERNLFRTNGIEKLEKLNVLTKYYLSVENTQKSNRYARQAADLAESLYSKDQNLPMDDKILVISACSQYGELLFNQGDYSKSRDNFLIARDISDQINFIRGKNVAVLYLDKIDSLDKAGLVKENFFEKTFKDIDLGTALSDATTSIALSSELQIAQSKENNGKIEEAINHYEVAIGHLRKKKGSEEQIKEIEAKIQSLQGTLRTKNDSNAITRSPTAKEQIMAYLDREKLDELTNASSSRLSDEILAAEPKNLRDIALDYEAKKDYEKSLEYYKMYLLLEKRLQEDSLKFLAEKELTEQEVILLKQQKQIADLNIKAIQTENQQQARSMQMLSSGGLVTVLATLVILFLYFTKKRQHKKLTVAYSDLDKTRHDLIEAENKISTLLKQQVSGEIALELLKPMSQGKMKFVCVMFLDIRDFTPRAEKMTPEELIDYQNKVFGFMIDTIEEYHGNINQIMGDGFMATFGAPKSHGNDCRNAYLAARKILEEVDRKNDAEEIPRTQVGIGLHAGQVVTGNVGTDIRKQYSVTGNTVIIASRVEQLNKKYKSKMIITEEVFKHIETDLETEGNIALKMMEVTVKGRKEAVRIIKIA